ncbi:MAG: SnoaL-like domain [Chloroflexi bacterium]|jgi:ketosteroid isomerase-like protein|nr:SnoaL-like domain [Chloroflexota bacterium]
MATRPVRFPPGSIVPAGLYRSTGSGRTRYFDGSTPLPGSVNSSSWQQLADHYRVVETGARTMPHGPVPEASTHPVRFAAGTVVSPGEYRNASSGAVRYFDGTTPLPGGVNATSWQQVSDHYHHHRERGAQDRRPLIAFPPSSPAPEAVAGTATVATVAVLARPAAPNAGELAVELVERVNAGDAEDIAALFTADAVVFFPLGRILICHRGTAQLRKFLDWLEANVRTRTLSVERMNGAGTSVTVDFDVRGRTASGAAFNRPVAMVLEADDGRIKMVHICLGAPRV